MYPRELPKKIARKLPGGKRKRRRSRNGMKVLVISDVHLKPWMFEQADKIMEQGAAERAYA